FIFFSSFIIFFFFFYVFFYHLYLLSFPTRRSSDLFMFFKKRHHFTNSVHGFVGCTFIYIQSVIGNKKRMLVFKRSYQSGFMKAEDRKSTRLNSSHLVISYAVFCLKKKKKKKKKKKN